MKILGWVFTVIGTLSFLGCFVHGSNPTGPLFWLGLGIYLIYRAGQKQKEKDELNKWNSDNNK